MSLARKAQTSLITMHCLPKILHGMRRIQGCDRCHRNISRFSDARINWAENMLQCRSESKIALIEASSVFFLFFFFFFFSILWVASNLHCPSFTVESTPEHPLQLHNVTYAQLYDIVRDVVSALLYHGLRPGDRVASYSSNCIVRVFSWRQWIYINSQNFIVRQMWLYAWRLPPSAVFGSVQQLILGRTV